MDQSPSFKVNSHSAYEEIPRLLWNPKVHYRVHGSQLPRPRVTLHNKPVFWRQGVC